jgi:radical SAM/Cys-rich protein
MLKPLPVSLSPSFPKITRFPLETLQVNLGYRCNQRCSHCHVNAGPDRYEMMERSTIELVIHYLFSSGVKKLDLTGGAPELNPYFRHLIRETREMDIHVMDRCNLTVLEEPGQEGLAEFLAGHKVEMIASMPCYLKENVDRQRGNGVYEASVRVLKKLNQLGYGQKDSGLLLNLVYNPLGPFLPPPQKGLEEDYRRELNERYGIVFNHLFTMINMPINRFGNQLRAMGELLNYMMLLRKAHREENLDFVMCRSLISIDWKGYVYDCDFNQMIGLTLSSRDAFRTHLSELMGIDLKGGPVRFLDHCYGCTAGQGSSCCGVLS